MSAVFLHKLLRKPPFSGMWIFSRPPSPTELPHCWWIISYTFQDLFNTHAFCNKWPSLMRGCSTRFPIWPLSDEEEYWANTQVTWIKHVWALCVDVVIAQLSHRATCMFQINPPTLQTYCLFYHICIAQSMWWMLVMNAGEKLLAGVSFFRWQWSNQTKDMRGHKMDHIWLLRYVMKGKLFHKISV